VPSVAGGVHVTGAAYDFFYDRFGWFGKVDEELVKSVFA